MSEPMAKTRALTLAAMVVLSVVAGTVALSGVTAAAGNVSITPSDDDAGAADVTYTADGSVDLDNQDTINYVDVHLGPADVSAVGTGDVRLYVDGNEYTDGFTEFSASSGTVEFKLSNSRSLSDGDSVRVVLADVTNPSDDFSANVTLHDTGDAKFQTFADSVSIDTPPSVGYSGLTVNETTVNVSDAVNVSATVENTGEQSGVYNASLKVDGEVVEWQNGTIAGETTKEVWFETSFDNTGAYDVTIKDLQATEVTVTGPLEIIGGSADPSSVDAGTTVSEQQVYVEVSNVSQDGNTDWHYVEFPNELADRFSVNSVDANATTITSSANIVDGFDDDGVDDTVKFATSGDGGGDIPLNLTVDVNMDYPNTDATYGVDARTVDSGGDTATQSDVAVLTAGSPPAISAYSVTNPSGNDVQVSFDSDEQLTDITVDISDSSGTTVATLTESDFAESGSWSYDGTYTVAGDGEYTATLTEAVDSDGEDGASGQSGTVTVDTVTTKITGASADPATVAPGSTVSNQLVTVNFSDVSADGDTDWYYVELPNDLASGLSVNSVSANATSITSSPNLVDGYDDDGVDDTVKFATSADDGGTIPLSVQVDVSVDYPDAEATYGVDARIDDSDGDTISGADLATIEAANTQTPIVTDFAATNPTDRDVTVSFNSSQQLSTITVDLADGSGTTVATLTESDFSGTDVDGTWVYEATYAVASDGEYTATLTEAADADGNDGADGESDTVGVDTTPARIVDGSASPATVTPGETVNNQVVTVTLADVSADGDTDWHYVEFPNGLASSLSVNSADANATSITSSAELVEGYDDDGVDDTVKFATSADGGGDVDIEVSVDVSVSYLDTERTYGIDAQTVDSRSGAVSQADVATIDAVASGSGGDDGGSDDGGTDGGTDDGGIDGGIDDGTDTNDTDDDPQDASLPEVVQFDLQHDGQDVDLVVELDENVSELRVNVTGAVNESLDESDFTVREQNGTYVYTADVSTGTTGTISVELEAAVNSAGSADADDTDVVVVAPFAAPAASGGVAAPPWVGAGDSTHTYTMTVPDSASVANETLAGVTVGYSEAFLNASGSVSSVSDDQNVVALKVVDANGTVTSEMGGTDAVSVNVVNGEVRLDLSDVDSSRTPTVAPGDRVVVRIRPVSNPEADGRYDTEVTLESASNHTTSMTASVAIRSAPSARAMATEYVGPSDERATLAMSGSPVIDTLAVESDVPSAGLVSATVPADRPDAVSELSSDVVSAFTVNRPDAVEDDPAALAVTVSTDEIEGDASDFELVRYDDSSGEWVRLDTGVRSQSSATVTLAANASETSLFALSAVDDSTTEETTEEPTEEPTTEPTDEPTDEPTTTETEDDTSDSGGMPGFTIGVVVVALVAAALLAARRRD